MEQRNLLLAFALSMVILLGWSVLFPKPAKQGSTKTSPVSSQSAATQKTASTAPELSPPAGTTAAVAAHSTPQSQVQSSPLSLKPAFHLSNGLLNLSLNDRGWVIGATLSKYHEGLKSDSPQVAVLYLKAHQKRAAYAYSGVATEDGKHYVKDSLFKLVKKTVSPEQSSLVLQSSLSDGRLWTRTITLHKDSYEVDIEDRIQGGPAAQMYTQIVEHSPSEKTSRFTQHEGPVALVNDKVYETKYKDLEESNPKQYEGKGGWIGMSTRYFIASIIGDKPQKNKFYFMRHGQKYMAGVIYNGKVEKKETVFKSHLFLGPMSVSVMKKLGVGLERAIDFGWFAFIAKPMHSLLVWLHKFIPNYGWCIIVLVLMIKAVFFYPSMKSYQSMAGMRRVQPEMARLKELYGDDRQKMGQEMMALYKKHKINPMGSCLPIAIQIPVFFSLYKVLLMSIEMRHAPFIFWIHDLSVQDPYYVLPIVMGISMLVQQKLNPPQADPKMAKMMQFLPIAFTAMFLFFPAGLVLYYVLNNLLSIAQQYYVMRKQGALAPSK